METEKKLGFSTRQIHVGKRKNSAGALCDPIYQTSTFMFETVEQGGARFAGTETGYVYSRPANPSTNAVEEKIASLESRNGHRLRHGCHHRHALLQRRRR